MAPFMLPRWSSCSAPRGDEAAPPPACIPLPMGDAQQQPGSPGPCMSADHRHLVCLCSGSGRRPCRHFRSPSRPTRSTPPALHLRGRRPAGDALVHRPAPRPARYAAGTTAGRSHRRDPAVKQVFVLIVLVTLGLGLINFNTLIDTLFGLAADRSRADPDRIDKASAFTPSARIFSIAIATVLFPSIWLAARDDHTGTSNTVGSRAHQIAFTLIPASVVSAVLAEAHRPPRLLSEANYGGPDDRGGRLLRLLGRSLLQHGRCSCPDHSSASSRTGPDHHCAGKSGHERRPRRDLLPLGIWGIPFFATSVVEQGWDGLALIAVLQRREQRLDLGRTARATVLICLALGADGRRSRSASGTGLTECPGASPARNWSPS